MADNVGRQKTMFERLKQENYDKSQLEQVHKNEILFKINKQTKVSRETILIFMWKIK